MPYFQTHLLMLYFRTHYSAILPMLDFSMENLYGEHIAGANLSNANLKRINLSEADLEGANLSATKLKCKTPLKNKEFV